MCRMRRLRIVPFAVAALAVVAASSTFGQEPMKVGDVFPILIDSKGTSDVELTHTDTGTLYTLKHPGATYLAIRFAEFNLAPQDCLVVSDAAGGQSYKLTGQGKMDAGTFWSQHVKGDTIVLELVTTGRKLGRGFVVDAYAAGFVDLAPPDDDEAICGVDDKENAVCYETSHPSEYDRGRAVARLLIGGSSLCTGWLVSNDDHLLTNEHCITSATAALNTDYEFMAEAPNCDDPNCQLCYPGTVFSGGTFIQDNANLDYCLVQVTSGNPAATYGYLEIDNRDAVPGEQIFIPQHPGGRAKEFGIFSSHSSDTGGVCRVYSITEPPCAGSGYNDVGYYCDTEGGSSGSPVLATSNYKVVALHHCALCPNRGVPIDLVYAEISDIIISTGLKVTPGDGLDSQGDPGGPFSPDSKVYTLENLNETPIDYAVTKSQPWVSLDNTGGTLPGSGSTTVTVSINENANALPIGLYTDTVDFINTTDHDGDTTRDVTLTVGTPTVVYEWTLDSDPGWSTEGLWAFGQPTGGGGQYGGPDPTSGYTGTNVYGYNLDGDYENYLPERHLTSTAIDCTDLLKVTLKFQRWLGVEQPAYDHAYVRVSNNGSTWTTVWENTAEIADTAWSLQELDISSVADDQSTVYLRWTMGTTDGSWQYCGWNIDDIQLVALDTGVTCTGPEDCDDGLWCNGAEDCVSGSCVPGTPPDCSDTIGCTDDSCNETTDSCDHVPNDANCDDSQYCNGAEWCDALLDCQDGTPVDCNDNVACTIDSCNETTDSCDNTPDDGFCDDTLFCNGAETCDQVNDCQPGSDPCPGQYCDEGTDSCYDCQTDPECDDGLYCNGAETCVGGFCQPGSDPCPGEGCDEVNDVCVPITCDNDGTCEAGEDCNNCPNDCFSASGASCGNGICEIANGEDCYNCPADCRGKTTGAPKNQYCCGSDVDCTDSRCTADPYQCTSEPAVASCCGDLICQGTEDVVNCAVDCSCTVPAECDDAVVCTDNDCVGGACVYTPNDAYCPDDGLFCNGTEYCDVVADCSSTGDPCLPTETCNEVTDTCDACLLKGEPCDPADDRCCVSCHPVKLTCK